MNLVQIPEKFKDTLKAELAPFEKVVWSGQPLIGKMLHDKALAQPIFSFVVLCVVGFIVWLLKDQVEVDGGVLRLLQGAMIFIVVLLLANMLRPVYYYLKGFNTLYLVTDKRALILSTLIPFKTRSFYPSDLGKQFTYNTEEGWAHIIFTCTRTVCRAIDESPSQDQFGFSNEVGFLYIDDFKQVEEMLKGLAVSSAKYPRRV